MPFGASWYTLLDELEALPEDATLITPLSGCRFRITDVQEHRVVIQFEESGDRQPLQCDQFNTLYDRLADTAGAFDLDRLPPDADPYPAVLSPHSRFEVDDQRGVLIEHDEATATTTQLVETSPENRLKEGAAFVLHVQNETVGEWSSYSPGGSMAPSCCIIPSESTQTQASAIFPSSI